MRPKMLKLKRNYFSLKFKKLCQERGIYSKQSNTAPVIRVSQLQKRCFGILFFLIYNVKDC